MTFSPGFKKYFANTSWLMSERILRIAVSLIVGVYVIRYLGPKQFGLLSYANSLVGLFIVLSTLGLDEIVVRDLIKNPNYKNELLGTSLCLKILGSFLMWISIAIALFFSDNDTLTNTLIAIIAFGVIFQSFNVIDLNYQANVQSKHVVRIQFIQIITSSLIKIILIAMNASLIWFAWLYLFDAVILASGLILIYLRVSGQIFSWVWKSSLATRLLKNSWPLILTGVAVSIYMKIDQIMIKEMLGAKEVGIYAAAVKLSEVWYFIPTTITISLFPAIISAKKESETIYNRKLQQLYDLMVIIAVLIALPTTFLAPWIIKLLFGNAYILSANVLRIYIWAGIFVYLGVASSKWYLIEGLTNRLFYRVLLGALVNIGLNFLLIPKLGINGCAYATFAANLVAAYLYDFFDPKAKNVFWAKTNSFNLWRIVNENARKIDS